MTKIKTGYNNMKIKNGKKKIIIIDLKQTTPDFPASTLPQH